MRMIVAWELLLWLVGYILGFVFFAMVPPSLIGWVIMPIGIVLTVWVLKKKVIPPADIASVFKISLIWTGIAIIGDYFGIVRLLHPADGYYKLDVYIYYILTFTLPLIVHWRNKKVLAK